MRITLSIAILIGTTVPAVANPVAAQLDALVGYERPTGPLASSWSGGDSARLGLGVRSGAWAGMLRVGFAPLEPRGDNLLSSNTTALVASASVEWYPLPGRWEPFVSIGARDTSASGYDQTNHGSGTSGATRVEPSGRGFVAGAGMQLTGRSDAYLAAVRLEVSYADGGMVFVGIGGELGAFVSR